MNDAIGLAVGAAILKKASSGIFPFQYAHKKDRIVLPSTTFPLQQNWHSRGTEKKEMLFIHSVTEGLS